MLLADGERAIVGSINFSPGSFDNRRELAIERTGRAKPARKARPKAKAAAARRAIRR